MNHAALHDNLSLLARIWAFQQSGTLNVQTSRRSGRVHALSVSGGGLVRGRGFQQLNAALRAGTIQFVAHQETQPGAWESTGQFLFSRAKDLVRRLPQPAALPALYQPRCDPQTLQQLCGLPSEALIVPAHDEHKDTRQALVMLGLLADDQDGPELSEEAQAVALDWSPNDLHNIIATTPPPLPSPSLSVQLKQLIADGQHSRARARAESALLKAMEQPALRLWLVLAWLSDPAPPLAQRIEQARQWIRPDRVAPVDITLELAMMVTDALQALQRHPSFHHLPPAQRRWLRELSVRLRSPEILIVEQPSTDKRAQEPCS